jgi:hypothetical protein
LTNREQIQSQKPDMSPRKNEGFGIFVLSDFDPAVGFCPLGDVG